ncbi:hypothetical protein K7X08_012944 [Anisodus acutangulus]|uniref:Uncharacterized protein n=1 Tax=Anisodus acutangulus TaxID=402998 RepID=A0A9Q1MA32_9SOLA|nr:hypothetical protein K7X08_012944 [Anisodus acutangulus]
MHFHFGHPKQALEVLTEAVRVSQQVAVFVPSLSFDYGFPFLLHAPLARMNALLYATCFTDSSSLDDLALAYGKLIQHLGVFNGYKEAFAALKLAEEKFLSLSKSQIQPVILQLLPDHALHTGNLKLAQQLCDELGVLASSVTGVDIEIKVEASLRHARILIAANQFSQKDMMQ